MSVDTALIHFRGTPAQKPGRKLEMKCRYFGPTLTTVRGQPPEGSRSRILLGAAKTECRRKPHLDQLLPSREANYSVSNGLARPGPVGSNELAPGSRLPQAVQRGVPPDRTAPEPAPQTRPPSRTSKLPRPKKRDQKVSGRREHGAHSAHYLGMFVRYRLLSVH